MLTIIALAYADRNAAIMMPIPPNGFFRLFVIAADIPKLTTKHISTTHMLIIIVFMPTFPF